MSDICLNHGIECVVGAGPCRYEMPGLQGEREGKGRYRSHKFVGNGEICEQCGESEWDRAHDWIGDVIIGEPLALPRRAG